MSLSALQAQFIQHAAEENRIAHLCIDNQAFFPFRNSHGDLREAFLEAGKHMSDTTNALASYVTSVEVMYEIPERARKRLLEHDSRYHDHLHHGFFDENALRVLRTKPEGTQENKSLPCAYDVTVDLLNPAYDQHHVFIKTDFSAFADLKLHHFLKENSKDVLLISGMYLSACVQSSVLDIRNLGGYTPIIIEDATFDFSDMCSPSRIFPYNRELVKKAATEWGIDYVPHKELLPLLRC